jgi:hypothetical protein
MWVAQQDPVPKHLPLLVDTKVAITSLVMQGTSLHFRKVKSHIGIIGNQYADELAKKAANIIFCRT